MADRKAHNSPWRDDVPRGTNPIRFLLFVSRPYRVPATAALLASITASSLGGVLGAYVFKLIVDAAIEFAKGGSATPLWNNAYLYIALLLISGLIWRLSGYMGMLWSTGVRATTRYSLSSYVTLHSSKYFSDRFAGSIQSKISNAANSLKGLTDQTMWEITPFIVTLAAALLLLYVTNPVIGLIFLAWIAVLTPLNVYWARGRVPLSVATQSAETRLSGGTVDILTNISAVHEYASRPFELGRLKELITERRVTGLRNWRYGEATLLINGLLQVLFMGSMILSAIYFVVQGRITAGDVVLLLSLILQVEEKLIFIGQQINNLADGWGQVTESLEDIVEEYEVPDRPDAKPLSVSSASVTLDRVNFNYAGTLVFDNLSLEILPGQRVGVVGRSGAGKSTLIKLLLRHYDVTSGRILVSHQDIAHATKESLRLAIAVVPQEPLLFHRSIRDNIAYGKEGATVEDVVRAAKLAQAHEFIEHLPGGYEALVGERGIKLSGGQRQRIAIARAIVKDAPILLLDEATSSLDSESEAAVQKALLAVMEHRTVIAIAHRLSTLRAMDRIIVMDEGRIIEDGSHGDLLAKGGLYADLWNHQAGGFVE